MTHMLSRHADCLYWLGRYIERTASLSRILLVQTEFDRGRAEGTGWAWILSLYDQTRPFAERYAHGTDDDIIRYFVVDPEHTGSLFRSLAAGRDNARAVRALISTDFWVHIDKVYKRLKTLPDEDIDQTRLARTSADVQLDCYALLGIAESSFYRDTGWRFFRLGVEIERADQMSRLLDVRFAQLKTGTADRGLAFGDFAFWSILLRACGGQHAYRRLVSGPLEPESIARFLILDQSFARSISYCLAAMDRNVTELRTICGIPTPGALLARLAELDQQVQAAKRDQDLIPHLHAFNDSLQRGLAAFSEALNASYIETRPLEAMSGPSQDGEADAAVRAGHVQEQAQTGAGGMAQTQTAATPSTVAPPRDRA